MAAKIVRQPTQLILLGSPTSAAAMTAGHEGAPAALRSAGLIARLRSVGYEVEDLGDDPVQLSKPDEESPRARNISSVLAALNALKPRVELAVKTGALPLILSGDCSVALATLAAVRRYFRNVALIYMDSDADLNTPATTQSGCLDGMVVSHITGRGAAELVRFWSEPPLARDPDVALFGISHLDPPERELLDRSMLRSYLVSDVQRMGAAAAARSALERVHGQKNEFVLHLDVDVIGGFAATNYPRTGGLALDDVRGALEVFVIQPHLAAIEVTGYNPTKDADGSGAKGILDLLADVLGKRLDALKGPATEKEPAPQSQVTVESAAAPALAPSAPVSGAGIATSADPTGESGSSDTGDRGSSESDQQSAQQAHREGAGESDESNS